MDVKPNQTKRTIFFLLDEFGSLVSKIFFSRIEIGFFTVEKRKLRSYRKEYLAVNINFFSDK